MWHDNGTVPWPTQFTNNPFSNSKSAMEGSEVFVRAYDSKDDLIRALTESNELLQEENGRYRRSNALLRRINGDLRKLKNIQAQNDEEFRTMCQIDFVADVVDPEDGLSEGFAS